MIPAHLRQYCQYIQDVANDHCSTRDFDDAWAPIGCTVRKELVDKGLCLEEGEVIIITQAVYEALSV